MRLAASWRPPPNSIEPASVIRSSLQPCVPLSPQPLPSQMPMQACGGQHERTSPPALISGTLSACMLDQDFGLQLFAAGDKQGPLERRETVGVQKGREEFHKTIRDNRVLTIAARRSDSVLDKMVRHCNAARGREIAVHFVAVRIRKGKASKYFVF